jgi:hypothetical protein
MKLPGFVSGSYQNQASFAAGERCVNFYPALIEPPSAKSRSVLLPCPGLSDFATIPDSPGRSIFAEESDRLFGVFGSTLNEVDSAGVVTPRGAVAIDDKPATHATNGSGEMMTTSGTKGYIYNLNTNTLTLEVSDVTQCGAIDTFFLALDAVTGTLKISESGDGTTWDPAQIAQRTAAPDPWRAFIPCRREAYLFGPRTGEVWYNAGGTFPFAQRGGAFFEVGIEAIFSLTIFGEAPAFLGRTAKESGKVYWMNGYTPNVISNEAVEWAIQQYKEAGTISDAIGWSYGAHGHSFFCLEFPSAGRTWIYDATTNQWHERGRWSPSDNDFVPYRARFQAECFDKNLVCDSQAGKIYSLSSSVYTDVGGSELRRVRRMPHISSENRRVFVDYLEIEAARGVGLSSGQGVDPQVMLRTSTNGGNTWGAERTRSLGKQGDFDKRIRWDRCGSGRDFVFEIASSDPVNVMLGDCYMGVS